MAESDIQNEELPLDSAGSRLRRTREDAGLSLGDVAARTKIAERHLASIEQSRFADLASRTYAVGFARAYARSVGLDEGEIAQAVRDELAASDSAREAAKPDAFEPGDPARVPGSRLAWAAALFAALVIVFVYWRSFFSPAVSLPDLTAEETGAPSAAASAGAPPAVPAVAVPRDAPVVFTALQPGIWVKFYDAAGNQLMQKQMAQGETYTVPADANGPQLRTARPDALQITVGGRIVPKLAERAVSLKDVPVSAAALLARGSPAPPAPASQAASPSAPTAMLSPAPALARQPSAAPRAAAPTPAASRQPAPAAGRQPAAAPSPAAARQPAAAPATPRPAAAASPSPRPSPVADRRAASPAPAAAIGDTPAPPASPPELETSTVSN